METPSREGEWPKPESFLDLSPSEGRSLNGAELSGAQLQPLSYWLAQPPTVEESRPEHPVSTRAATLARLARTISGEIRANLYHLLSLNHSRREALAHYLEQIAGITPSPSLARGLADGGGGLRRWVEGPRTPSQERALESFLEEVALICLGQSCVLKHWSDTGIRPWGQSDLRDLNWALSQALRATVPLDREGWQVTRPNLYSWYKPSSATQELIWQALREWDFSSETPEFLHFLNQAARQAEPDWPELKGFDPRFLRSVFQYLQTSKRLILPTEEVGNQPGLTSHWSRQFQGRRRMAFSPTLRDANFVRSGPTGLQWIGMEGSIFQLIFAELSLLWKGPQTPPLWAQGLGVEAHAREQLQLEWNSPKPSSLSRISEIEAFELALVLEERVIRGHQRSPEAIRFRNLIDQLPYFKKIRDTQTSLGDLQACVALSKLRPGGTLIWFRAEPLGVQDGMESLRFLLSRAKLVAEIDLSGLTHQLPSRSPLYPNVLYLWQREASLEERQNHRPLLVHVQGTLRSHVEVDPLWSDLFSALEGRDPPPRGHIRISGRLSPNPQSEWIDRWPDSAQANQLERLENLREQSLPLGQLARVRSAYERDSPPASRGRTRGFWEAGTSDEAEVYIWASEDRGQRRLMTSLHAPTDVADALLLRLEPAAALGTLRAYLESRLVSDWLEHHAERKNQKWNLKEQTLKWIPVPTVLIEAWSLANSELAVLGPKTVEDLNYSPGDLLPASQPWPLDASGSAKLFVAAARVREHLVEQQRPMMQVVGESGEIKWAELLPVLPDTEVLPFPLHPDIRMQGTLPPHLPIHSIARTKFPLPGILCRTEGGFSRTIHADDTLLLDMLWNLFQKLEATIHHPTWSELVEGTRLPRDLDLTRTLVSDILRSHGDDLQRLQGVDQILSRCLVQIQGQAGHTAPDAP